ncbi:hypothetical protein M527_04775 [Sphingobium indicum IP26]|uniref:Uncharacterized protein n=1 Tax=Sphingobium indicum F2 TaxID=1450518 RepID=A0A8E0WVI1_9SPHN|nr:hypothetical protein M527_02890 [Sphingobium indicum IP26]EPR11402.1 hypothetical protein M527_04775 [Sphingobium indicum IP26]KER38172.1 hypothetical protein AL00_02255 [Sphingobium indicum F2]
MVKLSRRKGVIFVDDRMAGIGRKGQAVAARLMRGRLTMGGADRATPSFSAPDYGRAQGAALQDPYMTSKPMV